VRVPRITIIKGQNGVGKSTLLYALKQRIIGKGMNNEDVIFISPSAESQHNERTEADVQRDEPPSRIASVLG
jgi:predicted ATPase